MSRFAGGKVPEGYSGSGPVKPPSGGGDRDKPVKNTTPTRGSQSGKPAPTTPTRDSQSGKPAPTKPTGKPAHTKPTKGTGGPAPTKPKGIK